MNSPRTCRTLCSVVACSTWAACSSSDPAQPAGRGGSNAGAGGADAAGAPVDSGSGGTTAGSGRAASAGGGGVDFTGGNGGASGSAVGVNGGTTGEDAGAAATDGGANGGIDGSTRDSSALDGATTRDASASSTRAFELTSGALSENADFPPVHTCAGDNHSPPFVWTAGPPGTRSYALVLVDMTNMLRHWAMWDIPATTTSLAEDLPAGATLTTPPAGAKQVPTAMGYVGPCPNGAPHHYVFTLYALDVDVLPGGTFANAMSAEAAILMHDVASASLSGNSSARRP